MRRPLGLYQHIKILVADDEELPRSRLCRLIRNLIQLPWELVLRQTTNGSETLQLMREEEFDIVFLDIEMPLMTGFQVVEEFRRDQMRKSQREPAFVYQTAYAEFGSQAFDQEAADYLLKPVNEERVKRSLERCIKSKNPADRATPGENAASNALGGMAVRYLSTSANGLTRVIAVTDIVYVSAESGTSTVYLSDGSALLLADTLTALENKLSANEFIRIHRSFIVSMDAVRKLIHRDGHWVELSNQARLPVARRKLPLLKERLKFT